MKEVVRTFVPTLRMEPQRISPKYEKIDFPNPLTFDQKVEIFRDRVEGWQLGIARQCFQAIPHSGFGALYICLSYFEMIARYRSGDISNGKVRYFFQQGFRQFADGRPIARHPDFSTISDLLYEGARCGLYHISSTAKKVYISGDRPDAFTYDSALSRLIIHPGILIDEILFDFGIYISRLIEPAEQVLRTNFQKKFNHDILPQIK